MLDEREIISFDDLREAIENHKAVHISFCRKFACLFGRNFLALYRNPASLIGRVVIELFVAATYLIIFWQMGPDPTKTLEVSSSLFFICIAQLALYEFATVLEF